MFHKIKYNDDESTATLMKGKHSPKRLVQFQIFEKLTREILNSKIELETAVTKSGTGTWGLGLGRGTPGRGTPGRGTPGCRTRGRGTRRLGDVGLGDAGTWDAGTWGRGTQGRGTRGRRDAETLRNYIVMRERL